MQWLVFLASCKNWSCFYWLVSAVKDEELLGFFRLNARKYFSDFRLSLCTNWNLLTLVKLGRLLCRFSCLDFPRWAWLNCEICFSRLIYLCVVRGRLRIRKWGTWYLQCATIFIRLRKNWCSKRRMECLLPTKKHNLHTCCLQYRKESKRMTWGPEYSILSPAMEYISLTLAWQMKKHQLLLIYLFHLDAS